MEGTELMRCSVTCVTRCAHGICPYWSPCLALTEIDELVQWHLLNGREALRGLKSFRGCETKCCLWAGRSNCDAFAQLLPWVPAPQLSPVHCSCCCAWTTPCKQVHRALGYLIPELMGTFCSSVLLLNHLVPWPGAPHEGLNPGSDPSGFDSQSRYEPRNSCWICKRKNERCADWDWETSY